MNILAFDATNIKPCVCLFKDDKIINLIEIDAAKPSEKIVVAIEEILKKNNIWYQDLSAIATTKGPASFTSIRINLSSAKMINLVTQIPLFTFDSLEVIAFKYRKSAEKILVAIDAKMDEFFIAEFICKNNSFKNISPSKLISIEELKKINLDENYLICGSGKKIIAEIFDKIKFKIADENDAVSCDSAALMAYYKLLQNDNLDQNSNALYLRDPKIGVRKK